MNPTLTFYVLCFTHYATHTTITLMLLITGATGFIGRSLTQSLERSAREFRPYNGRINDPLAIRQALEGVETVIHLVSAENRGRIHLLSHVDIEGTERLLEECERAQIGRLIYVSRLNADPHAWFPLLKAKGEVERLIRGSEIPHTIIRSATLFGRDDRFLNVIAALAFWGWPFLWLPNGGTVAMQPLWVEDFVQCLTATLDRPDLINQTIELAGEERLHYWEIARHILETTGMKRFQIRPPVKLFRRMMIVLSRFWRKPPVNRFFIDRLSVPEVGPLDSVIRYFNFHPVHMNQQTAYLRRLDWKRKLFRFDS